MKGCLQTKQFSIPLWHTLDNRQNRTFYLSRFLNVSLITLEKLTELEDSLICFDCISCSFFSRSSSSIMVILFAMIYSPSSLNSWLSQLHPGSFIFLDTQEQFLQHPYFMLGKIAVSFFYTVGIFSELRVIQRDIFQLVNLPKK